MSRTWRKENRRNHDRKTCPWCQENLHYKHAKQDDDEFEPARLDYEEDDELEG